MRKTRHKMRKVKQKYAIKFHVVLVASISSVAESKVNKGIAGIGTIKKVKKRELDTF